MTAFNEVLTTEQEAEQAIVSAKEEVAKTILAAKAEAKTKIEAVKQELAETEKTTLAKKQTEIDGLVEKIHGTVKSRVDAVTEQFKTHQTDLKSTLTNSL